MIELVAHSDGNLRSIWQGGDQCNAKRYYPKHHKHEKLPAFIEVNTIV
ncbi:hypothetical protein [Novosphingobium sp. B1]|nr:hypothetical protein [Novosphingobium sp. B1]